MNASAEVKATLSRLGRLALVVREASMLTVPSAWSSTALGQMLWNPWWYGTGTGRYRSGHRQ